MIAFLVLVAVTFVAFVGLTYDPTRVLCQPCRLAKLMLGAIANTSLIFGVFYLLGAFA